MLKKLEIHSTEERLSVENEYQTSTWGSLTQVLTESYSSVTPTLLSGVSVKLEWSLETVYGP